MKIDAVVYPYTYTDDGKRIHVKGIKGQPVKGAVIVETDPDTYEVKGFDQDTDCVGGVCPIK